MFSELIKSTSFWVIISVIVGFLLGEGTRWFRERQRIKKLNRMIEEELKSILKQIPYKKRKVELLKKLGEDPIPKETETMIKKIEEEIFSVRPVKTINIGYKNYIYELYEYLSLEQRNCLHFIYDSLERADDTINSFIKSVIKQYDTNQKSIANIEYLYSKYFETEIDSYWKVSDYINKYLKGNPPDVFATEKTSIFS